jgi:GH18 family chitinase
VQPLPIHTQTPYVASQLSARDAKETQSGVSSSSSTSSKNTSSTPPFLVFGYLPEYRQLRFDYEAFFKSGLTHLIFFSAEVNPTSLDLTHVDDRLPTKEKWATIRELSSTYGVKLLLCIGGGGRSSGFSKLVGDVRGRRRFIGEVVHVVRQRGLDGIDFNWEYPNSMTEWLNFGQLLMELRSALGDVFVSSTTTAAGRGTAIDSQHILLTMALHPHPTIPHVLRSSRVLGSLDYLHWMAYDHIVPNDGHSSVAYAASVLQDDVIGDLDDAVFNARLPASNAEKRHGKAAEATAGSVNDHHNTVRERRPHEVDHRRKLCLGIPFYGRHREDMRVPPESYEHLWQFIKQWARKRHRAWAEGGPELRALSNYAGYDYNGYDDVKRKMRLARASGIAGIMIWELGQDVPPGTSPMSLMTAVHEQLSEWEAKKASMPGAESSPHPRRKTTVLRHTGNSSTQSPRLAATPRRGVAKNATADAEKDEGDGDL